MKNPFKKFFEKRKLKRIDRELFDDTVVINDWLSKNDIVLSNDMTVEASVKPRTRKKIYIVADDNYIKSALSSVKLPIISEKTDNIKKILPDKIIIPDNEFAFNIWTYMTEDNYPNIIELFIDRNFAVSKKQKFLYDAATMLLSVICKSMIEQNELSWAAFGEKLEASKLDHPEFVTTLIDSDSKTAFEAFKSTINNKQVVYDIVQQMILDTPHKDVSMTAEDVFKQDSLVVLNSGKCEKTSVEKCNQFILERIMKQYTNYPSVAVASRENYTLFFIRNKYGQIYDANLKVVFSREFNMTDTYDSTCMLLTNKIGEDEALSILTALVFNCQYDNKDIAKVLNNTSKTDFILFPLVDKNKKLFRCKKENKYEEN